MSQQKRQLKNKIGLVGAICGSLLLSLPALAQTPANRDRPSDTQNGVMCSPNTSETNMTREGTSSANSNRNTPTTSANTSSSTMGGRTSASGTNAQSMTREGTSSANSNRNTPTTSTNTSSSTMGGRTSASAMNGTSSGTMGGRTSASGTNAQSMTREGTSSANSNRNAPTTSANTSSGTMSDRSSTMTTGRPSTTNTSLPSDPMSARDPSAVRMDEQAVCDSSNSTDMNRNTPSSTPPNRDKQMRRDNYQMMQQRPNSRIIPPTPEQRQGASASVRTTNGKVNVRLVNDTGANVVYEVIGDTNQRTLQGESYISLEALDTPTTITFYRQDGGLLRVRPQAVAPGMLEVRFAATTDLGADKNALTIQPMGGVYLN